MIGTPGFIPNTAKTNKFINRQIKRKSNLNDQMGAESRGGACLSPLPNPKPLSWSWGQHRKEKRPVRQGSRLTTEAENRKVSSQYRAISGFWESESKLVMKEEYSPGSEGLECSIGLQGSFIFSRSLIICPRQSFSGGVSHEQQTQASELYFCSSSCPLCHPAFSLAPI